MNNRHISFSPDGPSEMKAQIIKSIRARQPFHEFPHLKKRMWTVQMVEDWYFARKVGDRMTQQTIEKESKSLRSCFELSLR